MFCNWVIKSQINSRLNLGHSKPLGHSVAEWSLAVPIWLCSWLNDMSTAILYIHICMFVNWLLTKCFLIKTAQPKLVGKIKQRTRSLIFCLYNCMVIDRFGYANYAANYAESWQIVSHSLVLDTFKGRFKFAFRSLCQDSMIKFVELIPDSALFKGCGFVVK